VDSIGGQRALVATAPALIAEVLSPSSATLDLGDKAAEYLRLPSLVTYLVLSQDEIKVWVYLKGSDQHPGPKVITGASAAIGVPSLGIDLPLAEIYAGVEFENEP
jgi:Uma2 family endonuclease